MAAVLCMKSDRLVTRLTIEERMIQLAKEKLVLEQIVVTKMGNQELKQDELDGILRYGAAELFSDERLADTHTKGLSVTEQERARILEEGSAARIIYDEEMLEKLLDRSNMTTADEDKMEIDNGELMESFKIANFEVTDKKEDNEMSWQALLQHRKEVQEMRLKEKTNPYIVTPGRRRRRSEVVYRLDDVFSDDSLDSEYRAEGQEAEETESTDLEPDVEAVQDISSRIKKQKLQETPPKKGTIIATWSGSELFVLGFSGRDRQLFLNLLLRFGFPDEALDGTNRVEWTEFTSRFPRKRHPYIDDYARVLVSAAGGDVPPGVKMDDMLFDCKPEDLLARIGMMHLFRKKLRSMICHPSKLWISSHSNNRLYTTRYWKEPQDWALLRAVVKYGHGRWKDFLNNGENRLETILLQELGLEFPPVEEAIDLSGSPDKEALSMSARQKSEDIEAARRSKLRSIETKCRNWLSNRLKSLVEFISKEQESSQETTVTRIPITPHPTAATLVVAGTLKWKYEAMIRQCFSVRECSNAVTDKQTYEELQTAGMQFRKQMKVDRDFWQQV